MADGARMLGKRLLVIEDDSDSLRALSELLRGAGHEVLTAETGREGLKVLHAGTALDLVLLDFWLPDMTGHAFLATRTRWPGALSLPVLLVTGDDAWIDEHRDLRQLGVVGLLRKPLDPQQLLNAVEHASSHGLDTNVETMPSLRPAEVTVASSLGPGRQARRLSDMLVRASELLARSADVHAQLRDLAKLIVPGLADFCLIERSDNGVTRRQVLCVQHENPGKERELRALAERPQGLLPHANRVLDLGQPLWHETVSDEVLESLCHSDADLTALRRLGCDSLIVVPMLARGRVFGSMIWACSAQSRHYTRAHLETATDLAHRIALALDNDELSRSAREALRAREELLAMLSHNLRTPLSSISAIATKSLQSAATAADAEAASSILRSTRRMERQIRDLLDYAQLQAGSLRVALSKQRLSDLMRRAIESNRAAAQRHSLELEIDETARELDVLCDAERIMQVLASLIANALRATPNQGRITVRLSKAGMQARVSVSDSGEGLSVEETASLFERATDSAQSSDPAQNSELGLWIARGLIEAHGGQLWAQSEAGQGSTFFFSLNIGAQTTRPSAGAASVAPILLVDDDVAFRRELQEILVERGYSVETADNGWQAWSYLQANAPPALILLDLMMPVMDGWELHAAIKSHPMLAAVPTVIVSCLDRHRIEPSLADAQGYIEKPIRTAQLFDIVQRHVSSPLIARAGSLRPDMIE
jgi:signal transduction histidine kinase/DNA-binding response OmpR family regulator